MGKIIRLLAIDDNAERISSISERISKQDPEIKVEYPQDFKSLIQLIETNSYDFIIAPQEISRLNETELLQRISTIIRLPILKYPIETRLPDQVPKPDKEFPTYEELAERIKQTITIRPNHRKINLSPLPDTPKVIVKGEDIFIIHEDGTEDFWGLETEGNIEEIASQMELELRAVKWIKGEIEMFIGDLTEALKYTDVPQEEIPNIVFEGYRSLLFSFKKIDESINRS